MPTIGEQLKQAREARKLSIKQAVQAIHVRAHYLQAMETDDFSSMTSPAQARGFLRLYADYLGLDAEELTNRQRTEAMPEQTAALAQAPIEVKLPAPIPPVEPPPADPSPDSFPEETPPGPPKPSQVIFFEIGSMLRERRELISVTLDEIERHTHLRKHNLELVESGSFEELASPVQARGILSTYASFLDLDTDAVLLRYADALQSRRLERQAASEASKARGTPRPNLSVPFWLRRFISPDLIFGGGMVLTLLAISVWGAARILSSSGIADTTPTAGPSISDVLLASPEAAVVGTELIPTSSLDELGTPLPTLDPALIVATDTLVPTVPSAVQITIVVLERTFLRVTVDGVIKQDGRAAVGAALSFDGSSRIEILTGSGSAVQILFNQADLGMMGSFGEVVNRIYTVNGVETPTPTSSPTATITPKPSATLKPTLTSRPTTTPRPTATPRPTSTPRPTTTPRP